MRWGIKIKITIRITRGGGREDEEENEHEDDLYFFLPRLRPLRHFPTW